MDTTTLTTVDPTTLDDHQERAPVYSVSVFIDEHTSIRALTPNHVVIGWDAGAGMIDLTTARIANPDAVEEFLKRALRAVQTARVAQWPCHGACSVAFWPDDAWVCSEYTSELDAVCTRHDGHSGEHIACTADTHAAAVWPARDAA